MEVKTSKAAKTTAQPQRRAKVRVKSPTTVIHHCYTGVVFTHEPVELETVDSWTQSQIEAGKLELC